MLNALSALKASLIEGIRGLLTICYRKSTKRKHVLTSVFLAGICEVLNLSPILGIRKCGLDFHDSLRHAKLSSATGSLATLSSHSLPSCRVFSSCADRMMFHDCISYLVIAYGVYVQPDIQAPGSSLCWISSINAIPAPPSPDLLGHSW